MVWGIIGNSQKKNQKSKQDQGQRNIKSIPVSMMAQWVKESTCNAGDMRDMGLIPGSGRSPGQENGNPLQYSCLGNPMEPGGLQPGGVAKSVGHD